MELNATKLPRIGEDKTEAGGAKNQMIVPGWSKPLRLNPQIASHAQMQAKPSIA